MCGSQWCAEESLMKYWILPGTAAVKRFASWLSVRSSIQSCNVEIISFCLPGVFLTVSNIVMHTHSLTPQSRMAHVRASVGVFYFSVLKVALKDWHFCTFLNVNKSSESKITYKFIEQWTWCRTSFLQSIVPSTNLQFIERQNLGFRKWLRVTQEWFRPCWDKFVIQSF